MKVNVFQYQGKREYQQDAYHVDEDLGFFIVCDGVGGSADGGLASNMVVDSIKESLESAKETISPEEIKKAIYRAQNELLKRRIEFPEFGNSGTTLAMCVYSGDKVFTAHMGDSKVILIKHQSDKLWYTKDHSMVQELFDAGILKKEAEMFSHPMKNRITNGLFANKKSGELNIPINELNNLTRGDIVIICTDGIFEAFQPIELHALFKNNPIDEVVEVIKLKVESTSRDNSTFVLLAI